MQDYYLRTSEFTNENLLKNLSKVYSIVHIRFHSGKVHNGFFVLEPFIQEAYKFPFDCKISVCVATFLKDAVEIQFEGVPVKNLESIDGKIDVKAGQKMRFKQLQELIPQKHHIEFLVEQTIGK